MRKLDQAQQYLLKSVKIHNIKGPPFDSSVASLNLAQVESGDNLSKANKKYTFLELHISLLVVILFFALLPCAGQIFKLRSYSSQTQFPQGELTGT